MGKTAQALVLIFTVLGGLGGLACILEWLGVKPGDVRMTATFPHVLWLICGLLLFAVSIALSVVSWRASNKSVADALAQADELHADELRRVRTGHESDLYRARQGYEACREEKKAWEAEKQEYAKRFLDYRTEIAQYAELVSPLQREALQIAMELREFYASIGAPPELPQRPGESGDERFARICNDDATSRWQQKLRHGYALGGFGERITNLMHRLGKELGYPAYVPDFAEKIPVEKNDISRLAQQMEMIVIWINRKRHNEVDLLHEKS